MHQALCSPSFRLFSNTWKHFKSKSLGTCARVTSDEMRRGDQSQPLTNLNHPLFNPQQPQELMLNKRSPLQRGDYMCNGKITGMGSLAHRNWFKLRAFSLLSMINGTSLTQLRQRFHPPPSLLRAPYFFNLRKMEF